MTLNPTARICRPIQSLTQAYYGSLTLSGRERSKSNNGGILLLGVRSDGCRSGGFGNEQEKQGSKHFFFLQFLQKQLHPSVLHHDGYVPHHPLVYSIESDAIYVYVCYSIVHMIFMLLQLGIGFRDLMCIIFTALMVLVNEILVSFSLLVSAPLCCLEPLLALLLTNSENPLSFFFSSSMCCQRRTYICVCFGFSGRKRACVTYCIVYILSCITKHSPQYRVLMVGRILGGIATSLLNSAFESWLIAEHNKVCLTLIFFYL